MIISIGSISFFKAALDDLKEYDFLRHSVCFKEHLLVFLPGEMEDQRNSSLPRLAGRLKKSLHGSQRKWKVIIKTPQC